MLFAAVVPLGVAVVVWRPSWRIARHLVTALHELGHATAAVLFGRRIVGVRLHRDGSGVTSMLGPKKRPVSDSLISFAGYPAPAAIGFGLCAAVRFGRSGVALAGLALLFFLIELRILNLWGAIELVLALAALLAAEVALSPEVISCVALLLASVALAGSVRPLLDQRNIRLAGAVPPTLLSFDAFGASRRLHFPAGAVDLAWGLLVSGLAGAAVVAASGMRVSL